MARSTGPLGLEAKPLTAPLAAREGDLRGDLRRHGHPSRERLNAGQTPVLPRHRPGPGWLARAGRRAFGSRQQRSRIEQRRSNCRSGFAELAAGQVTMGNRLSRRRQCSAGWNGLLRVSSFNVSQRGDWSRSLPSNPRYPMKRSMSLAMATPIVAGPPGAVEARTYAKVDWRLIPFLFLCYILAYLDRVNVGFAKLQMLQDLSLSDAAFGTGRGDLLHRLLSLRGAQQHPAEEVRCPGLDRPDHDLLGHHLRRR